jgi:hypothetical protein
LYLLTEDNDNPIIIRPHIVLTDGRQQRQPSCRCFRPSVRERSFSLKGGVMVFFKKNILIPTVAEKNIQILVEEKKINLIQSSTTQS